MKYFLALLYFSFCFQILYGQVVNQNPDFQYFEKYLSSKQQYEMLELSFPTLDDCKLIFEDQYAEKYFIWISSIRENYFNPKHPKNFLTEIGMIRYTYFEEDEISINQGLKQFKKVKIKSVNTSEFKPEWQLIYKPGITIYNVIFLRNSEDSEGFEYNGFIQINNSWRFFPKPKRSLFL